MYWLYVTLVLVVEGTILTTLGLAMRGFPAAVLIPIIPLTLVVGIMVRSRLNNVYRRARRLSPQEITGYRPEVPRAASPSELSRSIVERAAEIRHSLGNAPSEVQVEMCALGYRMCANDMITLTHMINERLPGAGPLQRFKLKRLRKQATEALSATRKLLPPGALRAARQER